jgi:hypothetical protein
MNDKTELWLILAREKYPTLTEEQAKVLSMEAATQWYTGEDTELSNLFDQYVMLKNLKDL